jgi:hypothetical protein
MFWYLLVFILDLQSLLTHYYSFLFLYSKYQVLFLFKYYNYICDMKDISKYAASDSGFCEGKCLKGY